MTTVAVTGASGHSAATSRATCTNTHTQWWRWTGVPDPGLPTRRSTSYMADRLAGRPGAPAEQVVHGWDHAFRPAYPTGSAALLPSWQVVGGVTISRREPGLDQWLHTLAETVLGAARAHRGVASGTRAVPGQG